MARVDISVPHLSGTTEQGGASGLEVRHAFPCSPLSVFRAREFVAGLVRDTADRDAAILLVSELATNAVLHARTPFEVAVTVIAGGLRVEVRDHDSRPLAPPSLARSDDESGRGLFIVASLARVWGSTTTSNGKLVWFELADLA